MKSYEKFVTTGFPKLQNLIISNLSFGKQIVTEILIEINQSSVSQSMDLESLPNNSESIERS